MFRRFICASASVIALTASALAADLPSRAAPPVYAPPVPSVSWTGVYAGGQIGYGWGARRYDDQRRRLRQRPYASDAAHSPAARNDHDHWRQRRNFRAINWRRRLRPVFFASEAATGTFTPRSGQRHDRYEHGSGSPAASTTSPPARGPADPAIPFIPYSFSDFNRFRGSANGVIGGAHVGYNFQINQWVLGLEGDVDGSSLSTDCRHRALQQLLSGFRPDQRPLQPRRSGFDPAAGLVTPSTASSFMPTGGIAFGGFNTSVSTGYSNALFYPAFFGTDSFSNTRVGWTVGGGLEYAITNNWSVRAEYRYTDFGSTNEVLAHSYPGFNGDIVGAVLHARLTENRVQVGFSYKFDMAAPTPVVAKY